MTPVPRLKSRYEIKERLATQGAMGVVYRAWDLDLNRPVALKTVGDAGNRAALDLFRQECEVLATINHTNIVDIYDVGEMEEGGLRKPFFVMPFLPGSTLDALIEKGPLAPDRVVEILCQVCRGLQAAHERGVIHRDLKPSNIFVLDDSYSVKIIDFGVAHLVDRRASTGIKGTLLYMSPEQVQMKELTAQSDIFSLGVVGYEALTGVRPFEGIRQEEIAYKICTLVPPAATDLRPAVSAALSQVIQAAMAKQPRHRFPNAREFGECLPKALHGRQIERFDPKLIAPRVRAAQQDFDAGRIEAAGEVVAELEAEGHLHPDIRSLRRRIDHEKAERVRRELLSAAVHFFKQKELGLAREKIERLLQQDPDHAEALELKARIDASESEEQLNKWRALAREHLDNQLFSLARQALARALDIRPNEPEILEILAEVSRVEEEWLHIRREKEEHFQQANDALQVGDLSEAALRAGKLVDLEELIPSKTAPERAAAYRELFGRIEEEKRALDAAVWEAGQLLQDGEYRAAGEQCQALMARYPKEPAPKALHERIEAERRRQSAARIVEVDRALAQQADLDGQIAILRMAASDFPEEEHFQNAMRSVVARRDRVNTHVLRARRFEEDLRLEDAISEWEQVSAVYDRYPGLAGEIQRLRQRMEELEKAQARRRWREQAGLLRDLGRYQEALRVVRAGLAEFPGDPDLTEIERTATALRDRGVYLDQLVAEGRQQCQRGEWEDGLAKLTQAYGLDRGNTVIRAVLADAMLHRATGMERSDAEGARKLVTQILEIDPEHAEAQRLGEVLDRRLAVVRHRKLVVSYSAAAIPVLWRRLLWRGAAVLAAVALIVTAAMKVNWRRSPPVPVSTPVQVQLNIDVTPAWAELLVDGKAISGRSVVLAPRDQEYRVEARASGYQPAGPVGIQVNQSTQSLSPLRLTLDPLPTHVTIQSDMPAVRLEGKPLQSLADVEPLLPGKHVFEFAGTSNSTFSIEVETAAAGLPSFGKVVANHIIFSSTVAAFGKEARLMVRPAPIRVMLDTGAPQLVPPEGLLLSDVAPGAHTLSFVGSPVKHAFTTGDAPSLFFLAIADDNAGYLSLTVRPEGAKIFLDGASREAMTLRRAKEMLRLRPGKHTVRMTADGFQEVTASIEIQKGKTFEAQYDLGPVQKATSLAITGGTPGAEVFLDDASVGTIGDDGTLSLPSVMPGRKTISMRAPRHEPRTLTREIAPGEALTLAGDDAKLTPFGSIRVRVTPPGSRIRYRGKGASAQFQDVRENPWQVRQGEYELMISAERFQDLRSEVRVLPGSESLTAVTLTPVPIPVAPPPLTRLTLADFEGAKPVMEKGFALARNLLLTRRIESGTIRFTVQPRGGLLGRKRARWALSTSGNKQCMEFELDHEQFGRAACGQKTKAMKAHDLRKGESYQVRISIRGNQAVHEIGPVDGPGTVLDSLALPEANVEMRLLEAAVSDFEFRGVVKPAP